MRISSNNGRVNQEIKKNEMGEACGMCETQKMCSEGFGCET
jgi:hypothetical protein